MKNKFIPTTYINSEKQVLSALLLLCCLTFSACKNKSETNNVAPNPFASTIPKDSSQILRPCEWTFQLEQNSADEATLISIANIDSGWYLYSQHIANKGPQTEFTYDSLLNYALVGATEEGKPSKKYDPNLGMEVQYFENEATFKQKIKILSKEDFVVRGAVNYVICLTGQCVFSDEEFSFKVKGNREGK